MSGPVPLTSGLQFLGFDVYGTVVDWRSGVARAAEPFLDRFDIDVDPLQFADEWRSLYQPSMEQIRSGARAWVRLDVLNRESLDVVLTRHGVDPASIPPHDLDDLNRSWERLDPWPDAVEGLRRLRSRFVVGTLSNGHIAAMVNLARYAGLGWDVIAGAELTGSYKPDPRTYVGSAAALDVPPSRAAMVAAHNDDLHAARAAGFATVFVRRRCEHGPGQSTDLDPDSDWDLVVDTLTGAADALGCP